MDANDLLVAREEGFTKWTREPMVKALTHSLVQDPDRRAILLELLEATYTAGANMIVTTLIKEKQSDK